jgi:hypothetical protein
MGPRCYTPRPTRPGVIEEGWLRVPKVSFVYAVEL